jgi:dsDNA-specific endonuclease/ATPase MutS2
MHRPGDDVPEEFRNPIELSFDGVLDLHAFLPRDVPEVVLSYLAEARSRKVRRIRIVHGKGIGQQRERVHSILKAHPLVESFQLAGSGMGGWGATIVDLREKVD